MSHTKFKGGFWIIKIWIKQSSAANFIPKDLLEIICILERDEKHHSYKIIRNWSGFSHVAKFRTKNAKSTLLKNSASVQKPASHQDQKQLSSEDKLRSIRRKRGKKNLHPGLLD